MPPAARKSNLRLALVLALVGVAMLGVGFAFVPLYRMFCQAFGIPVPKIISQASTAAPAETIEDRWVTVRFLANTGAGVPVRFAPLAYTLRARVGEPVLTAYRAQNSSPKALDGVAVHMVYGMGGNGGDDMLPYIDLQQCFCFQQQHYPGSQQVTLPLSFTVRPDLPKGVHTLTFAYTLFEALPNDPRIKNHPAGS